jgi:hypothetical protein
MKSLPTIVNISPRPPTRTKVAKSFSIISTAYLAEGKKSRPDVLIL